MSDRTSEELRKRADLEQPEAGTDDMDPGWSPEMTAEEMEDLCDMLRAGADALDEIARLREENARLSASRINLSTSCLCCGHVRPFAVFLDPSCIAESYRDRGGFGICEACRSAVFERDCLVFQRDCLRDVERTYWAPKVKQAEATLAAVRAKLDEALQIDTRGMTDPQVLACVSMVQEARALCDGPEGGQDE